MIRDLARYWAADYDWRRCEAKLAALPQFMTEIDGLDIHFIHVRSPHEDAVPLIVTHGWPGSVIEQLKIVGPLTDPTAHGAAASDAFHLVIPSLPGYGFSGQPRETGWDPTRIARAWAVLMKRLGYTRFAAQGGDWGGAVTNVPAGPGAPPPRRPGPGGALGCLAVHLPLGFRRRPLAADRAARQPGAGDGAEDLRLPCGAALGPALAGARQGRRPPAAGPVGIDLDQEPRPA
jgi:pimeloyl-ACP methyl ester carboxylesterase